MKKLLIIPVVVLLMAGASPRRVAQRTSNIFVEQPRISEKVDSLGLALDALEKEIDR